MGKVKIPESEYDKIVDMYLNGCLKKDIAMIYNVDRNTIGKILKNRNIEQNRKVKVSEYNNIINLYNSGATQQYISNIYGVTPSTISYIIKNYDVNYCQNRGLNIPKSEYDNIVSLYLGGMSQYQIASIYNCANTTISNIINKTNTKTRPGGSKITDDDVLQWKNMYLNGVLLKEIADQFDVSLNTVSKYLKNIGVEIDRCTYHFNEHYFDNVDTPEKAYVVGLLWADGHNRVSNGNIILELQETDVDLLEKINILTENERPLRRQNLHLKNKNWKDQYRLIWHSKHTSKVLESYGMVQEKSLVLTFPEWLDDEFYSNFILGYFDGDGCISLQNNNKDRSANINMVGTRMFLERVADIIKNQTGATVYVNRDERAREPICILRCGIREDVIKILNWLYQDSTIYMQRKYDKYQQFLNNINNSYCA